MILMDITAHDRGWKIEGIQRGSVREIVGYLLKPMVSYSLLPVTLYTALHPFRNPYRPVGLQQGKIVCGQGMELCHDLGQFGDDTQLVGLLQSVPDVRQVDTLKSAHHQVGPSLQCTVCVHLRCGDSE